jgi:hypothetical protein
MTSKSQASYQDAAAVRSKLPRRQIYMEDDLLLQPPLEQPQPYENRSLLYTMHFFFAFVSRMWDMGIILLVAQLTNNSLYIVALTGLVSAMAIFLFMSSIGAYLDKTNRIVAVRLALAVKVVVVSVAYLVCVYLNMEAAAALASGEGNGQLPDIENATPFHRYLLYSLPVLGAVASMSFCAITQSIEKDWIVVLSNKDSAWLSATNSVMTQIDLACSSFAPAVTGVLFATLTHTTVSIILLFVNAASALALYIFMSYLYHSWNALGQKVGVDVLQASNELNAADLDALRDDGYYSDGYNDESYLNSAEAAANKHKNNAAAGGSDAAASKAKAAAVAQFQQRRVSNNANQINKKNRTGAGAGGGGGFGGFEDSQDPTCLTCLQSYFCACCRIQESLHDFLYSGCAGVMISYAALYLTVLSFGSLMTVYVRWAGVTDDYIGLFRGLNALFGYTGAVLFPYFNGYWGLWTSAQISLTYQFVLVAAAATSYMWAPKELSVWVVMWAVVRSLQIHACIMLSV